MKLHDLRNYLISSCRYLQTETGVESPSANALWVEWVVCRSLCVFRSVDISAIAGGDLDAALNLQVREWAPFPDPEYCYREFGNRALVWAWDGALRRQRCREAGIKPDAMLPESLAAGIPTAESGALVLVACKEGVEARFHRGEQLIFSRWWPQLPDKKSWNQLRMLFDLEPVDEVPTAVPGRFPDGLTVPLSTMLQPFLRAESTLFALSIALFLVFAAYYSAGIGYSNMAISDAEQRIGELNSAVTPVLEARDSALAALDAIENIATLHSGPLQLQYLSDLLAHLAQAREAGKDVELMAWDYAQSGVAISVAAETLSAAELLSVFESIPWLQAPRVDDDPVRGRMRVTGGLVEGWRFPSGEDATAAETAAVATAAVETSAVETSAVETAAVETAAVETASIEAASVEAAQ